MVEERRKFLKTTLGAGIVGVATLLGTTYSMAGKNGPTTSGSNGVVYGHSPKKEILYRKTAHWDMYYKSSY